MPIYTYRCDGCDFEFEATQSIKDKPLRKCHKCNRNALQRLLHAPICIMMNDVTTIGQLAEKNSKKIGKYKLEELEANDPGIQKKKKNKEKKELHDKINKMTPQQKKRYIEEGK